MFADKAKELVGGDRQSTYGHPFEDFSRTAQIWSAILGCPVSPNQVALCMVGVKISRETHKHKDDNIIDAHGYLDCLELVLEYQKNPPFMTASYGLGNKNESTSKEGRITS